MKNGFLDPENVCNGEITKIHKTQSSVPSSTCKTGSWPGFSKSSKQGSSVNYKLWKMDSMTPNTYVMKKLRKSIRPNHQYPQEPAKPEVDMDFRSHPSRVVSWYYQKMDSLTPKNVCNEEITKIHKTQSSVPSSTWKTGSWPGFFEVIQTW